MKETRASIALLLFILAAHVAYLLPQINVESELSQSYSITTCPGSVNQARSTALLPSKQVGIRDIVRKNADFYRSTTGNPTLSRGAIVVAGNPRNTLEIQTKSGKWTSAVTCSSGTTSSWFVGGTANVTSQGKIVLVNSGLSEATAEVTSYSENGPVEPKSITVKPLTEREIRIDSLDPGAERLVLKVKVISGRITSFLTDERERGLNNLGGDFVSPMTEPATELIIPALPTRIANSSNISHTLRVMSTEAVDTKISVEIISREGVFVPVGLGNVSVNAGEVIDLPIKDLDLGKQYFAIKVVANSPIVAGVRTAASYGSVSDFTWNSASPSFDRVSFNVYGLEPTISFVGENVRVYAQWRLRDGKTASKNLTGQEILNWKVPPNSRLVTLTARSKVSAGMYWATSDGVAYLPITSAATLESAARPTADISVIQPQT